MRTWILAIVLIAACKGKSKDAAPKETAKAALAVPKVEVANVLAKDDGKPPFLVIVDDSGARLAAASTWADLDAGKLTITKKPRAVDRLDRYVREDFAMEQAPSKTVASLNEFSDSGIELDLLEDAPSREILTQDDPPPPEEDDPPPPEEREEEDAAPRKEGQYKMKKNLDDPQLARQQAIEQARAAGILGKGKGAGPPFGTRPSEDGLPSRVAQVQGAVIEDGKLEPLRTLIFIAPTAKATTLIEAVRVTNGAIAVSYAGKIRPLRLQFIDRQPSGSSPYWLEARVSAKGIVIEAVPDAPIELTDLKQLGASIDKARKARNADADAPVDVLVEAGVDVQRLIDVIVALDTAGVRTIGLGSTPSPEELARRGRRIPIAAIGDPMVAGNIDRDDLRRIVRAVQPKILECYTNALAKNPELEGMLATTFLIKIDGTVTDATASGVAPDVAKCVAGVLSKLVFPKPTGGGGVQVTYPIEMRP